MVQMQLVEPPVADRRDRFDRVSDHLTGSDEPPASWLGNSPNRSGGRPQNDASRLDVMIVDDDVVVLQLVKKIFEAFGYRVTTVVGGVEAMVDLSVKKYDLLITDLEMPGMNGFRLAKWLKAEAPDTRVVIMTGRNRAEILRLIADGSVDAWIFKPFGLSDICSILGRLGFPNRSA